MPGAVVIGAGPGIGLSVARRFARTGMPVVAIARTKDTVDATVSALTGDGAKAVEGFVADSTDEAGIRVALDTAVDRHGVPDVLVYNAAHIRWDAPGELSAAELLATLAVNVVGAVTAAAHLGPRMSAAGHGTIILTGGMPDPEPKVTSLSLGKAGIRTLATLLAGEYGPSGVHVATVTVAGAVAPGTAFDPDDIAEIYWRLHTQAPGTWDHEVLHSG
ncbi:SDR family NAD(P)-dependent oxidoreductase [Streptosporangium oxazolinicum]|uniref:SDR family NAD(P)-dependent oxidoreductase n=1 Tax=Streptosporangium oxazolinicum TaxID=909287 RepID=A0ABP8ADE8_9ACTN